MVAACAFPSLRGSQVLIRETAERLAAAGHQVAVVTYPTAQHLVPVRNITIHRARRVFGLGTNKPLGWQKVFLDLALAVRLYSVVRRGGIQIIHAHNAEGPLVAYLVRWLTGVPVVYHAHNALADELPCYFRARRAKQISRWFGLWWDRRIARSADFTIALTERLAAFLAVRGAAGRVSVIPPGSSVVPARRGPRPAGRAPRIMYAGNLDPYQGVDVLLRAFVLLRQTEPRAELVVVTHEGSSGEVRRFGRLLGSQPGVRLCVAPSFSAARRVLSEADVLVCPRSSWSGFPIKVLNYMALGLPIVQAASSAHAIDPEATGIVFPDNDAAALARVLRRVVRDSELALRLGQAASNAALSRYGWPQIVARLDAAYVAAVAAARGRAFGGRSTEGWNMKGFS